MARAQIGSGARKGTQSTQTPNTEMYIVAVRVRDLSSCAQEENSQDRQIRTLNYTLVGMDVEFLLEFCCWL